MTAKEHPRASVVIPTRNRISSLLACLESLRRSVVPVAEVVIVDDASGDGTKLLKPADFPDLRCEIIHLPRRAYLAAARNAGARRARGEYTLFVDDDNVVDPRMIETLLTAAARYSTYGVLGPVMCYEHDPKRTDAHAQAFSLFTGWTWGKAPSRRSGAIWNSDGIPNVFLVRREVFERCGYFDETIVQTYTELEFAFRIRRAGYRCGVVPAARTYHRVPGRTLAPRTLGGTFPIKAYCLMRNRSVLVARYGTPLQKIVYFLCFSWGWPLAYSLVMLAHARFDLIRLYWRGWWDGVRYVLTGKLHRWYAAS